MHKVLDWNQMSQIGLVERINREILHPIGLAISVNPKTGASDAVFISDDGEWKYPDDKPVRLVSDEDARVLIEHLPHREMADEIVIMGNEKQFPDDFRNGPKWQMILDNKKGGRHE